MVTGRLRLCIYVFVWGFLALCVRIIRLETFLTLHFKTNYCYLRFAPRGGKQ